MVIPLAFARESIVISGRCCVDQMIRTRFPDRGEREYNALTNGPYELRILVNDYIERRHLIWARFACLPEAWDSAHYYLATFIEMDRGTQTVFELNGG